MLPAGFEPTISAGERPQTYTLDRAATGTGFTLLLLKLIYVLVKFRSYLTENKVLPLF